MDDIRTDREVRDALIIGDPRPLDSKSDIWVSSGHGAIVGIFLLLFGAFLYVGRAILLPIFAAAVLALTLTPVIKVAKRFGIPTWLTAIVILLFGLGGVSLAAMALARPVIEWIARGPEIVATVKDKLSVLDQPMAALHQLEGSLFGDKAGLNVNMPASTVVIPVVAFLTPAAGELVLFFTTLLFFLVGEIELRNQFVALFGHRDSRLRFLKIMRDIERNLAGYLAVVTTVNIGVACIVSLGAWLIGFPNPLIFGFLAGLFNYVRALYRSRDHGGRVVWCRSRHLSFADPCADRAAWPGRADHFGGPCDHPDDRRAAAHAQPIAGVFGAGVLDLDVGPVGGIACSAAIDHRACGRESPVPVRGCQAARVNGTFAGLSVLFCEVSGSFALTE